MLLALKLDNVALIDALDLEFSPGLTVLTGETGAGKSLLLDSLDVLLGAEVPRHLLRHGQDQARIEGRFAPHGGASLLLEQRGLGALGQPPSALVVTRRLFRRGERISSRGRINGISVNRRTLLELRPLLIDLTVQGQTQRLGRPSQQRRWLDGFGDGGHQQARRLVAAAHETWVRHRAALDRLKAERTALQQGWEENARMLVDLRQGALEDPQELATLKRSQDRLAHALRLQQGSWAVVQNLQEPLPGQGSALDLLGQAEGELRGLVAVDPTLEPLLQRLQQARDQVQDVALALQDYGQQLESQPLALADLQERIAQLQRLERRYGHSLAELIRRRDELEGATTKLDWEARQQRVEQEERAAHDRLCQACGELRQCRQQAADRLVADLMAVLRPMGLEQMRFAVELKPRPPTEHGSEEVCFLFSANPGETMAPLGDVASGGEMSRFLLSLKTCLARTDLPVTLLFDEIDSGVSGRVSAAMAELLHRLARCHQVFCVTHQPLIAARADHHFRVSKHMEGGRTRTRVTALATLAAREEELAQLAGGNPQEARRYVASLLRDRLPNH
ncbi:DNA repair protein RecN [Candidatus Synechococcus spongiarum]|uniref:DNA repair protein RecN n=1 Tax=Candidatus Synechococcus spongiarum TaxID=431041 RepID=UPI00046F27D4|nr:DNA repair protein RecN [Candidatus Synechococcus spongiarum]